MVSMPVQLVPQLWQALDAVFTETKKRLLNILIIKREGFNIYNLVVEDGYYINIVRRGGFGDITGVALDMKLKGSDIEDIINANAVRLINEVNAK